MTDQASTIFTDAVKNNQQSTATSDQGVKTSPDVNSMFADQLNTIINEEGKPKYSSVDEALKALKHSQEHIRNLERENSSLKATTDKSAAVEDILNLLNSNKNKTDDNQGKIDIESIKNIVASTLTEKEKEHTARQNAEMVKSSLIKVYGEKAAEVYRQKAVDLGLDIKMLDSLATTAPKAVLEYFSIKKENPTPSKHNQGSVNTDAFNRQPQPTQVKPVMYGASSDDIKNAWRHAVASVVQQ